MILAVETSCDETAAAVMDMHGVLKSHVVASSEKLHSATGGIVPEVAARAQVTAVHQVIVRALKKASIHPKKLSAIAVTVGPGLVASLVVGITAAAATALRYNLPVIPVHHIHGHIVSGAFAHKNTLFPLVVLTASGGHTQLSLLARSWHSRPKVLGTTRDDAAGEAFDKAARILGLGYPGGPAIEAAAQKARPGFAGRVGRLPRAWLLSKDLSRSLPPKELSLRLKDGRLSLTSFDFSFSGLKTALARAIMGVRLTPSIRHDFAAAFQEAVVEVLTIKAIAAARKEKARSIGLAGGCAANAALRFSFEEAAKANHCQSILTPRAFCTDNAAMIALAGLIHFKKGRVCKNPLALRAQPNKKL